MIFTLYNVMDAPIKGFQVNAVAVSAGGYGCGFSELFLALIDSGAYHTSISSDRMRKIKETVCDANGHSLAPVDEVEIYGITGKPEIVPLYVLPHLYLGEMHFTDVVVTVPTSKNFDCLIGRSILHQCVLTLDSEVNKVHFDFKDSLKQNKWTIKGIRTFSDIQLFAEFSTWA